MSGRRLAMLSACLVVLAGSLAGVTAAAPSTPANVDVSVLANNDAEDAVAVNPTNPSNVVAMAITFTQQTGLIEGVSFNAGRIWTRQIIGGSTADPLGDICCDEQLAWDRYGNLWMTYLLNSTGDVLVALSTDGGLNCWKDGKLSTLTTRDGLSANGVNALYEDGAGELWIGTKGGGLNRLKAGKFSAYLQSLALETPVGKR